MLRGRIEDRNLALVARALEPRGARVHTATVVGDRREDIAGAVRAAIDDDADLVVVTGGLGPTHDDLSMAGIADAAGVPLHVDERALRMASHRNARVPSSEAARRAAARKQGTLPAGSEPLPPAGTAPGAALRVGDAWVVALPGPPWELSQMLAAALDDGPLRELGADVPPPVVARLFGVPESRLVESLDGLPPTALRDLELGICARDGELELTLRPEVSGAEPGVLLDALEAEYGEALYSRDGTGLDDAVAASLRSRGETLAVAESCTGGGLGARITARAGSSAYFLGGVLAYDDAVKREVLGVPDDLLARDGAVSVSVAEAMASGARRLTGADWALSVTGVAGPGGGSADKPVGLVYVCCAGPGAQVVDEHRLSGDRERVRQRAVALALQRLRRALSA